MARLSRLEIIDPSEPTIVHVINRTVRRCFLMGDDPFTGQNFDHRKQWIEVLLERFAAHFGIELLCYSILSNHYHLILRTQPELVADWGDSEIARRWLMICPARMTNGEPAEPTDAELNAIRNDPERLAEIRCRLSDPSWWMRLLNQRIAQRANREDEESGKFWQDRFRAIRIEDEESLLACAAYVDLNQVRAGLAETIEESEFSSIHARIESEFGSSTVVSQAMDTSRDENQKRERSQRRDKFLSKLTIDERQDDLGICESDSPHRLSDKGFLPLTLSQYIELLEWTVEQTSADQKATTVRPPVALKQTGLSQHAWKTLVDGFAEVFTHVAARIETLESCRSRLTGRRFRITNEARQLVSAAA
ncbi:transposase [Roseiconus lacunae]|uniref:transposase n=1 Tax=Roseiconus lacunae TaxID=2605694 RepID=UPI0011F2564C|nr:transposase [Roseiconus lacunae]